MSKPPPDPLYTLHSGMKAIYSIFFRTIENKQRLMYCGTESGHVHVWDFQILRQLKTIRIGCLPCIAILHHTNFITQEKGGDISFWKENGLEWEKISRFDCHYKMFCRILLPYESLIYPCSDKQIKFTKISDILSIKYNGVTSESKETTGMIMCSKFSCRHNCVILTFENGTVCTINPETGKFNFEIKFNSECPLSFDYCDSADFGIIGYNNKDIIKFTIDVDRGIEKVKETLLTNPGTSSIAIRHDGILFVVGTWDKAIRYFSAKSLKLLAVLNHHNGPVEYLHFINKQDSFENESDNFDDCLLAGSRDGRVSIWNLYPT